jgi:transcriptional regulator with XRE-family HTH domain
VTTRREFGDELRRERERRGITLEHISQLTKISAALLKGLERGDCSRWPAGIYSRAYIREYAQTIGLDRDDIAGRFCECFSETAFPEGAPTQTPDAKDAAPNVQPPPAASPGPLRLTLNDEPQEHRRELARRAVMVLLEVCLSVAIAGAVSMALAAGFWVTLALVSLGFHIVGIVRGRAHAADALLHLANHRGAEDAPPATAERALAEAA